MTTSTTTTAEMRTCALGDLKESVYNPRRHFDDKQLADLVESIKSKGILNPLLVRPVNGHLEIVGGARRFRAAQAAGLEQVPVIVRTLSDTEALEVAVIDNLQRVDVHPLDEAEGYSALLDQQDTHYDVAAIAAKVGKSTSYVYQRLKLVDLIEPAKKAFWKEQFTAGHAVLIARLRPEDQKEVLAWYADSSKYELVGTRELARHIDDRVLVELNNAPWGLGDSDLVAAAGSCTACPKRSSATPELFADIKKGDRCLDRPCFGSKLGAYFERRQEEAKKFGLPVVLVSPEYGCPPGVLKSDRWHKITNKKKCDKIAKGVLYSGGERGQIIDVCTGMRCPIHSGIRHYDRDPKEVEKEHRRVKQGKRDQDMKRALLEEAVHKAPGILSRKTLEGVAVVLGREYGFDDLDAIFDFRHDEKQIRKLDDEQLAQFITAHTLTNGYGEIDDSIAKVAKSWGVDVGAVEVRLKLLWATDDKREKEILKEKEKKGAKIAEKALAKKSSSNVGTESVNEGGAEEE
jgi:ParB family chromosome partitioning protein